MDKNEEKREKAQENYFIPILIILIAFSAFGLGRLSTLGSQTKGPIVFEPEIQSANAQQAFTTENSPVNTLQTNASGSLVASKNGTKYHFPWCSGAQRIKEENEIWFNNEQEARKAGYTPAANCKGLK
ncbi:MAG: hypothetical protein KAR24_01100 [Candidatus Pacebacteria bacterium]|nr:hypothetical protein [Candidatus Paceibacterota bacterium]